MPPLAPSLCGARQKPKPQQTGSPTDAETNLSQPSPSLSSACAGSASAQIIIQATDIVANTTWGDNETEPIILQQPIFVKNGATLTILPGTIVRGQPRTGPVVPGSTVGTPGALIVTPDRPDHRRPAPTTIRSS